MRRGEGSLVHMADRGLVLGGSSQRAPDDDAASEVVGSIILVAITVILAGALAALVYNVARPVDLANVDLEMALESGDGVWGNGNEVLRLNHRGGEALEAGETKVTARVNGVATVYEGTTVGSAFGDGTFVIGEQLNITLTLAQGAAVEVLVVVSSAGGAHLTYSASGTAGVIS